ncbi:hypothetical protein BH24GEM2_BH24GEM2_11080 [soil metagenome]
MPSCAPARRSTVRGRRSVNKGRVLSAAQWEVVRAAIPPAKSGRTGTPRTFALREMWNAIFYQAKNGCTGAVRAAPYAWSLDLTGPSARVAVGEERKRSGVSSRRRR